MKSLNIISGISILFFFCGFLHAGQTQNRYLKQLRELADGGNIEACVELGNCYYYGRGLKKDPYSAFNWYFEAADRGNGPGQFNLALCYDFGIGTSVNKIAAIRWYQKAADNGVIPAKFNMAMYFMKGEKIEFESDEITFNKDPIKSLILLKDCSKAGFPPAERELAKYYLEECPGTDENFKTGMECLFKAARGKDPEALYMLAKYYIDKGEEPAKVFPMLKTAAEGDVPQALEVVGEALECGIGTKQDRNLAFDYYKRAAEHGLLTAQLKLADYYAGGIIVNTDIWEARKWYMKAAAKDDPYALFILGSFAEQGIGGPVDNKLAFQYYQKAAAKDFAKAQFNLATFYARGEVVQKDMKMAYYWYRRAALQNDPRAQCELGFEYILGLGAKKDYNYGLNWLSMSEKSGNVEAESYLDSIQMQGAGMGN